jgi:hypothetical protein
MLVTGPEAAVTVVPGAAPVELAVGASAALYERAPVVVLAAEGDLDAQERAAEEAERRGGPLLLTPAVADEAEGATTTVPTAAGEVVAAELDRLRAESVLAVGSGAVAWAGDHAGGPDVVTDAADLPRVLPAAEPLDDLLVLVGGADDGAALAVAAMARAVGADVLAVAGAGGDPRADPAAIRALAAESTPALPGHVLAVGDRFGPPEILQRRLAVAATGVQLPGGGQVLYPYRRMTALYGHPGAPVLGVLGEQPLEASIARARQLAASYDGGFPEAVPAFEIIAAVASSAPGPDGNYSNESTVDELRPWVDAAEAAGVYVVLDIQPGRTDFLTQARRYEELLVRPHVGLALDPEWRLGPDQLHMAQIGSVDAAEVNTVVDWLAGLTRAHVLPQKLLLLHQFQSRMITDRQLVETGYDELAVLVHADGFGTHGQKFATWAQLQVDSPPGLWWGWKNFYDEDQPMMNPAETAAVRPGVFFVSYQ